MGMPTPSLRPLWMLRLGLGAVVLLASLMCFLGTSWDIQWHSLIGRDRILIPPHEMMLGGVALTGIPDIVLETIWARHSPLLAECMVPFAGFFKGLARRLRGGLRRARCRGRLPPRRLLARPLRDRRHDLGAVPRHDPGGHGHGRPGRRLPAGLRSPPGGPTGLPGWATW